MFTLKLLLILQIFTVNWRLFQFQHLQPTFNKVPCSNDHNCNYYQAEEGFQCSLCAEDKTKEKHCLATFLDKRWFLDECELPKTCNMGCRNNGKCVIEKDYKQGCVCPQGFYGQFCEFPAIIGQEYFRMIQWHRKNAFVKPGEITRFYFKIDCDAKLARTGVNRMFKTGLGNIVNLGEAGKRGHAPDFSENTDDPSLTVQFEDYIDMQYPYLLPENEYGVTVLKMNNKLKGYLSTLDVKTKTTPFTYTYYTYKVFVNYDHIPVMKCIPVIRLTNCARTHFNSSKSVFHRNENIIIKHNVKFLEDGAYLSTAKENRQKCTMEDTTWIWTWSKCNDNRRTTFQGDVEMIEEGSAIGNIRIFEKFTLGIGKYRVNLRIKRVIQASTNENFDECYFQVKPLPLKAVIEGGEVRRVMKNTGVSLVAKHSYDPNQPSTDQSSLMILWTCECLTKHIQNCEDTCKMNKNNPVWLSANQEFFLYSTQLQYNAEYKFTLTVDSTIRYKDTKIAPQFSYVTIKVANESDIAVTNYFIACVINCLKDGTLPNEVLFLKAKVSVIGKSKSKVNKSMKFNWVYSKENDSVLHPVDSILLTTDLPTSMLAIKEGSFTQGVTYTIMLREYDNPEHVAQYSFKMSSIHYEGGCRVEPESGVKGLTPFDIICDGFEGLVYEFYDKSEEDVAENLVFNGRMLGTSEFHGVLNDVRITRGHIVIYIINKISGLYIEKSLKVQLSPWNLSDQRMKEIRKNLTSTVNLNDLSSIMNYISFIPDTLPEQVNKHEMLNLLLEPISQVTLNTVADVKLSASTMKIVLQTLNRPTPLNVDLGLISKTLALVSSQTEIIVNAVKNRGTLQWMSSQEVKLVATALLECLNTALKCESVKTSGLSEEKTGFDTLFLLRQNAKENSEILDKVKDILSYIQAPGLPPNKLATFDKSFQIWTMGNDEEYPVTEMLKKDDTIPFSASKHHLQTYSKSKNNDIDLFFQVASIDRNVFSWSKSDVKSKLVSLSMAVKKGDHLNKVKLLSSPIYVRLGMEKNLANTTVMGSALQLDPGLDPDTLDIRVTVHRIDCPPKGFITIRFIYPPTSDSLRVLVLENYRPDYELMTQSKDVVIINSSYTVYPINHRSIDVPMFLYMGVLPVESASVNHTVNYEFLVTTNLCQLWIEGQWSSIGCVVSTDTTSEETVCACNHLSIFAAAFPVPPQSIDPLGDARLFLTVLENPLVVAFVIVIFILYLLLVLWGRHKDNVDQYKGKVVVLDDNFPEDTYPYLVAVHTSTRFNAGTTAHVGIKLAGKEGNSRAHILSSERRRVLTRNSDDWFMLYTPKSLGSIYGIHIWHDNYGSSPEWFCDKIVVYDLTRHTESVFMVEQWLALREGDYPEANLVIATGQEMLNIKRMFLDNAILGFRDTHVYLSVFVRHPRSEFTRVQRISVLMCLLMVAMLCSIMFYTPNDNVSPTDDYQYDVGMREIIISVESLIITATLTLGMLFAFKRSYKTFHERLHTTRQYRRDEIAEAISQISDDSRVRSPMTQDAHSQLSTAQDKSFYQNYVRYVSKFLRGPPLAPVYLWEGERRIQKRKIWYTLAWVSCITIMVFAAYLVMLYGLKLGLIQSQKWLTAVVMSIGMDIFIMGPGRIITMAILLSMAFQTSTKVDLHGIALEDAILARPKNEVDYLNILLAKRSHPMYAPLTVSARGSLLKRKKIRRKWWNLIDFVNAVIYVTIVSTVIYRLWISHYHGVNHLHKVFSHVHRREFDISNINKIKNLSMVENYMEFTFVEVLFDLWWYNKQLLSSGNGTEPEGIRRYWIEDGLHKAISKPLIRQVRVVPYACRNVYFSTNKTKNCLLKWSLRNKDKNVYGEKWVPATYLDTTKVDSPWEYRERSTIFWWTNERFYGAHGRLYDVSGYGTYLGPTLQEAQRTLAELRENLWQDWYTRACFLSTTVYNVNEQTFTQITTLFEYYVDGSMYATITTIPVSRIILIGVWEFLFLFAAVYYVFRSGYLINRLGLIDYLKNLNNITRVINVFLAFLAVITWCVHHTTSIKYSEKFMKSEENDYFDFDRFIGTFSFLQIVLSLLLCFAISRAFMCMRGGRRFLNAYYAFIISLTVLFWLALHLLLLLFIFKRLQYFLDCQNYFRTKELSLTTKMTLFLNPSILENLNVRIFVLLRVVGMFFVRTLFIVLYLYFSRIAKAYNPKDSDSFNFVLFVIERSKRCLSRDRNRYY